MNLSLYDDKDQETICENRDLYMKERNKQTKQKDERKNQQKSRTAVELVTNPRLRDLFFSRTK